MPLSPASTSFAGTFYNDLRQPGAADYSEPVRRYNRCGTYQVWCHGTAGLQAECTRRDMYPYMLYTYNSLRHLHLSLHSFWACLSACLQGARGSGAAAPDARQYTLRYPNHRQGGYGGTATSTLLLHKQQPAAVQWPQLSHLGIWAACRLLIDCYLCCAGAAAACRVLRRSHGRHLL